MYLTLLITVNRNRTTRRLITNEELLVRIKPKIFASVLVAILISAFASVAIVLEFTVLRDSAKNVATYGLSISVSLVEYVIPCSIIAILHVAVNRHLRKMDSYWTSNTSEIRRFGRRPPRVTRLIVEVFLLCHAVKFLQDLIRSIMVAFSPSAMLEYVDALDKMRDVAEAALVLNASCIFVIYLVKDKKFREVLRAPFERWCASSA